MKTTEKRKKKLLAGAAALALVGSLAGTFAWQTYQDQKLNRVNSADVVKDAVTITEDWSKTPITPGGYATKDAKVTNTSDVQVFVRASFEEVMKHLTSKGQETTVTTATTYDPETAATTDDIPVSFAGDSATLTGQGLINVSSKIGTLPAGVEVWAKGNATQNPIISNQIDYTFEYKVFYKYQVAGVDHYQKMSATIEHDKQAAAGSPVTNWVLTGSNYNYFVYAGGYNYLTYNWGKSNLVSPYAPVGTTTPTDTTLIGYSGTNNGEVFDYTVAAGVPAASGLSLLGTEPATGAEVNVFGDSNNGVFGGTSEIKVVFGDMTDTGTLASDSWVYNKEDGWFYYLAKLDASYAGSGTAGQTKSLITQLKYGNTDDRYINVTYDLTVKMEAVQANDMAAVTDTFGLTDTAAGTPTELIYTALSNL